MLKLLRHCSWELDCATAAALEIKASMAVLSADGSWWEALSRFIPLAGDTWDEGGIGVAGVQSAKVVRRTERS